MIKIEIAADLIELSARLRKFQKSFPRRTSFAMNRTLFDVRDHIIRVTYPRAFTVRNTRFARFAFRVDQARPPRNVGRVFDSTSKDYLIRHAEGGVKLPSGRSLAIPAPGIRRLKSGAVPKSQRPRSLLAKPNVFTIRSRSGQLLIVRRMGRRGARRLETLYFLEPRARIRKTFNFYAAAARVANDRYPVHWEKEMKEGLRRAFPNAL